MERGALRLFQSLPWLEQVLRPLRKRTGDTLEEWGWRVGRAGNKPGRSQDAQEDGDVRTPGLTGTHTCILLTLSCVPKKRPAEECLSR